MSDNAALNRILSDLASGVIDTQEAQRRIAALDEQRSQDEQATQEKEWREDSGTDQESSGGERTRKRLDDFLSSRTPLGNFITDAFRRITETNAQDPSGDSPNTNGVDRVIVNAVGRRVRLVGDPTVVTAVVEGSQHTMRRSGTVLEIRSNGYLTPTVEGFTIMNPSKSLGAIKDVGLGKTLTVRINPEILVDAEVTAGSLTTKKLPRLGKIRVTAGGAKLMNVVELSDALVQAGNANISGPIAQGRSRIRVESGNLTVTFDPAANVSVKAESNLGLVSWPDEDSDFDEYIVGNGSARLDISVVMGYASVRVKEEDRED